MLLNSKSFKGSFYDVSLPNVSYYTVAKKENIAIMQTKGCFP